MQGEGGQLTGQWEMLFNPIMGDANLHHTVYFHEKMIDHLRFGSRAFFTFNIFSFCT